MAVRVAGSPDYDDPDKIRKKRVKEAEEKIRKQREGIEKSYKNSRNALNAQENIFFGGSSSHKKTADPGKLKSVPYMALLSPAQLLALLQSLLNPDVGPSQPNGIPFDLREQSGNVTSGVVLGNALRSTGSSGGTGSRDNVKKRVEKAKAEREERERKELQKKQECEKKSKREFDKHNRGNDDKKPLSGSSYSSSSWASGSGGVSETSCYASSELSVASGPRNGEKDKKDISQNKLSVEKKPEKPVPDVKPREPDSKVIKSLLKKP